MLRPEREAQRGGSMGAIVRQWQVMSKNSGITFGVYAAPTARLALDLLARDLKARHGFYVGPDYGWKEHCQSCVIAEDSWWVKDGFRIMV